MGADPDGNRDGLQEGLEESQGDPRVLVVLNAVLSTAFVWLVVWGGSFIGAIEYSYTTIAVGAIALFLLTHVMTRP